MATIKSIHFYGRTLGRALGRLRLKPISGLALRGFIFTEPFEVYGTQYTGRPYHMAILVQPSTIATTNVTTSAAKKTQKATKYTGQRSSAQMKANVQNVTPPSKYFARLHPRSFLFHFSPWVMMKVKKKRPLFSKGDRGQLWRRFTLHLLLPSDKSTFELAFSF